MGDTAAVHDPGAPLLARFYDELYLPAFHHQREPLAAWQAALAGGAGYDLDVVLAGDDLGDPARARLTGGIVSELYPGSACGLLTYVVVAPGARRAGLGRALVTGARRSLAARAAARGLALGAVFGEVAIPRDDLAWERLERFQRWGARVVDHPYVQPSLGSGLPRDPDLHLVAFVDEPAPATLPGSLLDRFLRELFLVTERAPFEPGPIAAAVALRTLHR